MAFSQDGDRVSLRFSEGDDAVGDVLVGADGLNSVVRGELHGHAAPVYRGYVIWRGILDKAYAGHENGQGSETLGHGLRFGLFGTGADRSYWYACESAPEGSPDDPRGTAARLYDRFGAWPQPIASVISAIDGTTILRNDAYDRPPLRRWGKGRVTLLGDAAHPTTPNLGQGACLALEDALVLARCLAGEPGDEAEALRCYEALRRRRTAAIVLHSRWLGAMGQWRGPIAVPVRNTLGRLTPDVLASGALRLALRYRA
jgi:2-polyprenyl-6-methoxyphenol hydroxylase-like FAD-dependent oxidoreductase